jgi:hypothetical protein
MSFHSEAPVITVALPRAEYDALMRHLERTVPVTEWHGPTLYHADLEGARRRLERADRVPAEVAR